MKWARIFGGVGLAAGCGAAAAFSGLSGPISWTIAITTLTAAWWVTEAIPIPATSLIPFAAFPMAGVIDHREAARRSAIM